jgi:hypothetical protein
MASLAIRRRRRRGDKTRQETYLLTTTLLPSPDTNGFGVIAAKIPQNQKVFKTCCFGGYLANLAEK